MLTRSLESSEVQPFPAKTIGIDGRGRIWSVAFLVDGKHVASGDMRGKIRRWRVEDGTEAGTPMDAGGFVCNIAVSRDGKWIVSGTSRGLVQVWNADDGKKVTEFKGHHSYVNAVDVSPDSTKIASGSTDRTACVWSLSTGQRLLGPWEHDGLVFAVKFSPDGCFIATAGGSISVYDDRDLVFNVPIDVAPSLNHSLAWSSNSKQLFAVYSGEIICLDAFTGATLSQWFIHGDIDNRIALASDGALIAASSGSSISFWDATTHEQIGSVVQHTDEVECMAISADYDIAIGGGNKITLCSFHNILPFFYCSYVSTFTSRTRLVVHHSQLDHLKRAAEQKEHSLNAIRAQYERSGSSIRCPASHLLTCSHSLEEKIADLENVIRDLRHELATASKKEKSLNETIDSLVAQDGRSSTSNSILTSGIDVRQTTKSYNYNKERTTSHTLFMSTSRSTNVKLCMQRAA